MKKKKKNLNNFSKEFNDKAWNNIMNMIKNPAKPTKLMIEIMKKGDK